MMGERPEIIFWNFGEPQFFQQFWWATNFSRKFGGLWKIFPFSHEKFQMDHMTSPFSETLGGYETSVAFQKYPRALYP